MTALSTYTAKQLAVVDDGQLVATFLRTEGQGPEVILTLVSSQDEVTLGDAYVLSLDKQAVPQPLIFPEPSPVPAATPGKTPYPVPNLVPQAVPGAVPGYAYVMVIPPQVEAAEPYKVPQPEPMLVPQLVPYMTPQQVAQIPGLVPMKVPVPNPEVPEAVPYVWPEQSSAVPVAWVVPPMNVPPLPYIVPPPVVNEQRVPVRVPGRIAPPLVGDPEPSDLPVDVPMRADQDPDVGALVAPEEG